MADGASIEDIEAALIEDNSSGNAGADLSHIDAVLNEESTGNEMGIPEAAYNTLVQFSYGLNKSIADTIDFFGTDIVNGLLAEAGVDYQLPTAGGTLDKYAGQSDLPEGLLKEAATRGGEMASLAAGGSAFLKQAGKQLPSVAAGESALTGTLREITNITPKTMAAETALGGVAGVGAEVGKEVGGEAGEIAGAVVAPVSAGFALPKMGQWIGKGFLKVLDKAASRQPAQTAEAIREESERLIYNEAMKSGMTRDEIVNRYLQLGEQGTLADVDPVFAQAVRNVANEDPRFQGAATRQMRERQAGQGERIEKALDTSMGTQGRDIESELSILDERLQPQIKLMYDKASQKPIALSPKLRTMIEEPKGYFKDASKKARKKLETKRATGDTVSHFDVIDAHKKALDDMIGAAARKGENEKVRDLVRAKNDMLAEVDSVIPEYAEARRLYAGRASLENAFDMGQTFIKPNVKVRDIEAEIERMTPLEKHFYKLGVKRAFQDVAEGENVSRDLVNKYFMKGGTADKLRLLFDDDEAYNSFVGTLRNELDFSVTRNLVTGNSTTFRQQAQSKRMNEDLLDIATDLSTSNIEKGRRILKLKEGLNDKESKKIQEEAKRKAGEFLLNEGLEPEQVRKVLESGSNKQLLDLLDETSIKMNQINPAALPAGISAQESAAKDPYAKYRESAGGYIPD